MVKRYQSIFFDLDDTLWNTAANARDSFRETYHLFHLNRFFPSFESFYTIYQENNERLWADYAAGRVSTKEELNERRFSYPLKQVGVDDPELVNEYSAYFLSVVPLKEKLIPSAREVLNELKRRKYRLFILSNGFRELQDCKMRSANIHSYFEKVVLSDDIGVLKPNPLLYYFALSATQSELRTSIMIGDNFNTDITGAYKVGMDQVFFNPGCKEDLSFKPTYEIKDLKEILELFP